MLNLKITKIKICLKSFNCKKLLITCIRILAFLKKQKIDFVGPISIPTKKRKYCILRSPHIYKDSREQFEIRKYTKLIYFYSKTYINFKLLIPSGIEIKFFL